MHTLKEIEDAEIRFHDDVLHKDHCVCGPGGQTVADRMVWRLRPSWGEGAGSGGQRGGARARRRGGWAPWGGILAPCLGVLIPFPETGAQKTGLFIWEVLIWGCCGDTRSTGGKRGLEWEIWASAVCNGNQRASRMGWRP